MVNIPEDVLSKFSSFVPSVLATSRDNKPYTTFISWLILKDGSTVRFALSRDSYSAENLRSNPYASVEIFGEGIAMSISGTVKVVKEEIDELSFPVSVFEMKVENVSDNLFPGANITGTIPFEHSGDVKKAEELDEIVLKYLRE